MKILNTDINQIPIITKKTNSLKRDTERLYIALGYRMEALGYTKTFEEEDNVILKFSIK